MTDRVVLVATTHRVAPGLLSWDAWQALREGPVLTGAPDHPQLPALDVAGVTVEVVPADGGPRALAATVRERARGGTAVWLAAPDGDEAVVRELGRLVTPSGGVEIEVVYGSYDVPGARLLDVVATMDRLRSPGGCPWDAQQTHESLAPYLIEEAYETLDAIERGDRAALREELGDVLLQVAFHSRVAEEAGEDERWSIDDVAGDLVDKLVRRHPHVFGDRSVSSAAEVQDNWDVIKAAEKQRSSVTEGVPLGQAALTLAATLQRKAGKAGLPPSLLSPEVAATETPAQAVGVAAAAAEDRASVDAVGELLWTAVVLARSLDVDPEAALRGRSRAFRDRLSTVERAARDAGLDPTTLDAREWEQRWHGGGA